MSNPFTRGAAACALLVVCAAAQAAPATAAHPAAALPKYESLDANGDGVVTLPEVVVKAPEWANRIRHCDTDKDQALSRGEYAACKPLPPAKGG